MQTHELSTALANGRRRRTLMAWDVCRLSFRKVLTAHALLNTKSSLGAPSTSALRMLFLASAIPFVGFGFLVSLPFLFFDLASLTVRNRGTDGHTSPGAPWMQSQPLILCCFPPQDNFIMLSVGEEIDAGGSLVCGQSALYEDYEHQ